MWFEKKSAPDWHESFVADVRHVFKAKALSFEQATEALRTADGRRLLDFDIRARRGYNYDGYPGRKREPSVLKVALGDPEHADVFLFYKSCSNNGFLREEALRALRGHHGRLVCAAALIRVEDWVPQVADISLRLLQDLAAIDTAVHFFEFLDLIAALRSRLRFKPHWAATTRTNVAAAEMARCQARGDIERRCGGEAAGARVDPARRCRLCERSFCTLRSRILRLS